MTTTEEIKLLPCPFCGKEPVFTADTDVVDGFEHSFTIACHECGFHICDEYKSDAAASWNRRSALQPATALMEAIDDLVDGAEIEWSYREDNHRYPRDFWHARISFLGYHDTWTAYGKQEQRELPDNVKMEAEKSLRDDLRAAIRDTLAYIPAVRRVRHKKRGSTYVVLGEGEYQDATLGARLLDEGQKLTVYRCEEDGKIWLRHPDEFEDGRFEDLA